MHISLGSANSLLTVFPVGKLVHVPSDLCKRVIFGTYFIIANVWKQVEFLLIVA